jgi:hypothetical protein
MNNNSEGLNGYLSGLNGAHILNKSEDIIKYTGSLMLREIKSGENAAVIFPNRRPAYFTAKYFNDTFKKMSLKIDMFAIDDFIDRCYESSVRPPFRKISPTEAAFLLFDLNAKEEKPLIKNAKKLDLFLPWGYKLFADFEELCIELISRKDLSSCDEIIAQKLNPEKNDFNGSGFYDKFSKFSDMYKNFYEMLYERKLSSRSHRYKTVAEITPDNMPDKSVFAAFSDFLPQKLFFSGFYGITNAEDSIIKNILKIRPNGVFSVSKSGEKTAEVSGYSVKFNFHNTSSVHGEIMKLKQIIKDCGNTPSLSDLIVLSSEDYLFPILHNVLNLLGKEDYNISIGYSLARTPLYALFNLMSVLHGRKKEGKFYSKDYISLFLHPYVKNISGALGRLPEYSLTAEQTGGLFQSVASHIKKNNILFISLKDIENIKPVVAEAEKIAEGAKDYFAALNEIFIGDFESIENIKNFIEKIIGLISIISHNSIADKHPYGLKFMESAVAGLIEFSGAAGLSDGKAQIDMSSYRFDDISGYFNLLKNILKRQKVPFEGAPVNGLQVLGALEARNISFERVFYLGANEGTVPDVSKENTMLTEDIRKFLNISGAKESAGIQEHNFFDLIYGSKEVHFFYNSSNVSEKSSFIEKIMWDIQKESKNLKEPKESNSVFKINFRQKEPRKIKKSEEIKKYLSAIDYSPAKLDAYLKCPSMFYYTYVLGLREGAEVSTDIDAAGIGNIIHGVLREYFEDFLNKPYIISDTGYEKTKISKILDNSFSDRGSKILGLQKKQIRLALERFISDRFNSLSGAVIIGAEHILEAETEIESKKKIKLNGRADLIFEKNGRHFIIDYKTGGTPAVPDKNFIPSAENRNEWLKKIKSFQLPFYIMLYYYSEGISFLNISAALWGIKKSAESVIDIKDPPLFDSYEDSIKQLILEIINSDYFDFATAEENKKICGYCNYSALCGKI